MKQSPLANGVFLIAVVYVAAVGSAPSSWAGRECVDALEVTNTSVLFGLRGKSVLERQKQIVAAELLADRGTQLGEYSREQVKLWAQGLNLEDTPIDFLSASFEALRRAEFERSFLQEQLLSSPRMVGMFEPELNDGWLKRLKPTRVQYVILPFFLQGLNTLRERDRADVLSRAMTNMPRLTHVEAANILLKLPVDQRDRFAPLLVEKVFTFQSMYEPALFARLMQGLMSRQLAHRTHVRLAASAEVSSALTHQRRQNPTSAER